MKARRAVWWLRATLSGGAVLLAIGGGSAQAQPADAAGDLGGEVLGLDVADDAADDGRGPARDAADATSADNSADIAVGTPDQAVADQALADAAAPGADAPPVSPDAGVADAGDAGRSEAGASDARASDARLTLIDDDDGACAVGRGRPTGLAGMAFAALALFWLRRRARDESSRRSPGGH